VIPDRFYQPAARAGVTALTAGHRLFRLLPAAADPGNG
jgi:hypothetical protein